MSSSASSTFAWFECTHSSLLDAGNIIAQVKSSEALKIVTVRSTAFDRAALSGGNASVEDISAVDASCQSYSPCESSSRADPACLAAPPAPTSFVSTSEVKSDRPDLGSAGKVVSGGRALKNKETFGQIMEPLADVLGAGALFIVAGSFAFWLTGLASLCSLQPLEPLEQLLTPATLTTTCRSARPARSALLLQPTSEAPRT